MSCNSCAKPFSLLRKEKGCPSCGFSFCSKCLSQKMHVSKINTEAKVCMKCKLSSEKKSNPEPASPPQAFLRRSEAAKLAHLNPLAQTSQEHFERLKVGLDKADVQIVERLQRLRERDKSKPDAKNFENDVIERLKKLRGDQVAPSVDEIQQRLNKLRDIPECSQTKNALPKVDLRSDQEKSDDLIRQYLEEIKIDQSNKEAFDKIILDIEARLNNLKDSDSQKQSNKPDGVGSLPDSDEDDQEYVSNVIKKIQEQAAIETDELGEDTRQNDELPWCEICNEDAVLRCLGCKYLFCKRCYLEHRDDDPECNRYEPYRNLKKSR